MSPDHTDFTLLKVADLTSSRTAAGLQNFV